MKGSVRQLEFPSVAAGEKAGLRALVIDSLARTFRGFWPDVPDVDCERCGLPAAAILQPCPSRDGESLAAVNFAAACRDPNCGWWRRERFTAAEIAADWEGGDEDQEEV